MHWPRTFRLGPEALGLLLLTPALLAAMCTELPSGKVRRSRIIPSDSAGVEILSVPAFALEVVETWTLDTVPALSVGETDGDPNYLFDRIVGAVRFPDGSIGVADGYREGGSGRIRVYDRDGAYLREFGRRGNGPGEVISPELMRVLASGDLAVFDWGNRRLNFFSAGGELLDETSVLNCIAAADGERAPCRVQIGLTERGHLVVRDAGAGATAPVGYNGPGMPGKVNTGILGPDGYFAVDSIAQGDQFFQMGTVPAASLAFYPRMYGALPQWAVGGDVVAISDPHSPDIHLFDQWGILRRIVRMDWEATPVTRSMVDRYREAAWEPGRADTIEPWISQFPAADSVARHGALMVDQSGRLWVEDYKPVELAPTDEPSWWTVFDRNGLLAFRIELPSRSKLPVFQIDATSILSRSVDELGVQRITLWRMGPRPG